MSRLIGSPPSYVGSSIEPILGTETLNKWRDMDERKKIPEAVICFDEIEKGAEELHQMLLGLLDGGTITMGDNSVTDLTRSIVIMTTNCGSKDAAALKERGVLGFSVKETGNDDVEKIVSAATKSVFSPEFLNRLDKLVTFKSLTRESVKQILSIELGKFQKRVIDSSAGKFLISITPEAKEQLLSIGYSEKFGGREIRRTVDVHIAQPVARLLASGQLEHGDLLFVGFDKNSGFTFCKEVKKVKTAAPVQIDFEIVNIPVQSDLGSVIETRKRIRISNPKRHYS
jgi:ATP-dependent Clp protease ATP-binding subunit ClpA